MSHGIFGSEELEEIARVAAARCREEMFTTHIPYGPMTAEQAARAEQLQQLVIQDGLWAMRVLHAWDIRESVYATIDVCKKDKAYADDFVKKHPALSLQGSSGVILIDNGRALAAMLQG